jgi:hypothetical protein
VPDTVLQPLAVPLMQLLRLALKVALPEELMD